MSLIEKFCIGAFLLKGTIPLHHYLYCNCTPYFVACMTNYVVFLLTTRDDINLKNLHVYGLCKAVAAVLNIYTSTCLGW